MRHLQMKGVSGALIPWGSVLVGVSSDDQLRFFSRGGSEGSTNMIFINSQWEDSTPLAVSVLCMLKHKCSPMFGCWATTTTTHIFIWIYQHDIGYSHSRMSESIRSEFTIDNLGHMSIASTLITLWWSILILLEMCLCQHFLVGVDSHGGGWEDAGPVGQTCGPLLRVPWLFSVCSCQTELWTSVKDMGLPPLLQQRWPVGHEDEGEVLQSQSSCQSRGYAWPDVLILPPLQSPRDNP